MEVETLRQSLVDNRHYRQEEKRPMRTYSFGPLISLLFIVASILGCYFSLKNVANRYKITNIYHFLFVMSEGGNMRARGIMWRVVMMYSFFLLGGVLGVLNWIPYFRKGLDRKSCIPLVRSWRSLIFLTAIGLLNILWVWSICAFDLSLMSFNNSTIAYLYKISSYWLNLLWTLSVLLCTRNTIWQQIYNASYSSVISTHKYIGGTTFIVTIAHILLAFAKWHANHSDDYWAYLWAKIINYSPIEVSWRNPNFMWATDRLLKTLPFSLLMMLSSITVIRRACWELFYYLHQVVIILLLIMFVYHSSNLVYYATIPFILYGADKLLRWLSIYSRYCTVVSVKTYEDMVFLDVVVKDIFDRDINFPNLIGAVVYLRIPAAKLYEYHPISLAFNKGNHFYFYIKVVGNKNSWTHKLAALSGQKGLRAYIEGPYTMMRRESEVKAEKAECALSHTYGDNVVIVGGGVGFAGVSSYLNDFIDMTASLPLDKQATKHLHVLLVVPHHRHLQCMSELLLKCKKYPFCNMELFVTYSAEKELRDKGLTEVVCSNTDIEAEERLQYAVGRPDLSAFFDKVESGPLNVYYCGPIELQDSIFKSLLEKKRAFSFYPEVFDM